MSLFPLLLILAQPSLAADEKAAAESHVFLEDYAPCGIVSLYLVCRMRDMSVTWEKMKELVGPADADGSHSFEQLSRAAAHLALHPLLDLHLRIKAPQKPQSLQAECKLFFKYGKATVPVFLYIYLPFTAGPLTPDADAITFAAAHLKALKGQTRLVRISLRDPKSDVQVRQVPDWLECKIVSQKGNTALLSLKIKDKPPKPFVSANLQLAQGSGEPSTALLPIRAFAPGG